MNICSNCKHILKEEAHRPRFFCKINPDTDYVTGKPIYADCYEVNPDGKCNIFEDVSNKVVVPQEDDSK